MSRRVYELARELELDTKEVIGRLNEAGVEVKHHSASVEDPVYERVFGADGQNGRSEAQEAEASEARAEAEASGHGASIAAAPVEEKPEKAGGAVRVEPGASVKDLGEALGVPPAQIIKVLMGLGEMKTLTQTLSTEEIELVAEELGAEVEIGAVEEPEPVEVTPEDDPADLVEKPPVVTVMGHVDHGKTSLLDRIRQSNVQSGEAGGITQHIGAYQVESDGRKVTFIDTPGHEAFTEMRARGARVTDVVVLVVAADDGVMPQTQEAIEHARAAEVPIVVALNKIDVPNANTDRVLGQLSERGLVPEVYGGQTVAGPVSGKTGGGVKELLENILIVAELEDLKANPKAPASGYVIESERDPGRGPVATLLINRGMLHKGDVVLAGTAYGRVRAMFDYKGKRIKEVGPGSPVEILGLSGVGAITDSDVMLGSASGGIVLGFNVRPTNTAKQVAEREKVEIRTYNVIYKALEDIESAMRGMLAPETEERETATAEVRQTFRVPNVGVVAGCYVTSGEVFRNNRVRVVRDGTVVYEGQIASLKRFKDDVRSVRAGFECGVGIENFNDVKKGDVLEFFEIVEVPR